MAAPYTVNSPAPNGKTPNLIFSDVYQGTLNNPIISIPGNDGLLFLNMSGYTFPLRYPVLRSFNKKAYTAGTTGVYTINTSACTVTIGKAYKFQVMTGDGVYSATIIATATTTSTTDLASAINTALTNANQSSIFTNTVATTTVTVNEAKANTGGITIISLSDTNVVITQSTANVLPFGTVAQVALYKPSITTGTYNRYQFGFYAKDLNFEGTGYNADALVYVEVWVDTGATGYSTADTQLTQFQPGGSYWGATYSNILALPNI